MEAARGGVRAGVQVGAGDGAGDEVGAGAVNEDGERGGSERIMEGVNRHGNEEFEGVVECVHMNGDGVICGECEGNERRVASRRCWGVRWCVCVFVRV